MRHQRADLPLKLDGLGAARAFFAGCFADADASRESLFVAHIDGEARCVHLSHHTGGVGDAALPIAAILADALRHRSVGLVLAHNHPSGDSTPSDSDCRATRRLATAADAIDCTLVDHLVFAGAGCASFRRLGLL